MYKVNTVIKAVKCLIDSLVRSSINNGSYVSSTTPNPNTCFIELHPKAVLKFGYFNTKSDASRVFEFSCHKSYTGQAFAFSDMLSVNVDFKEVLIALKYLKARDYKFFKVVKFNDGIFLVGQTRDWETEGVTNEKVAIPFYECTAYYTPCLFKEVLALVLENTPKYEKHQTISLFLMGKLANKMAAQNDSRLFLEGVVIKPSFVNIDGKMTVELIATDGHKLAVAKGSVNYVDFVGGLIATIPCINKCNIIGLDVVRDMVASPSIVFGGLSSFYFDNDGKRYKFEYKNPKADFTYNIVDSFIDSDFVDYKKHLEHEYKHTLELKVPVTNFYNVADLAYAYQKFNKAVDLNNKVNLRFLNDDNPKAVSMRVRLSHNPTNYKATKTFTMDTVVSIRDLSCQLITDCPPHIDIRHLSVWVNAHYLKQATDILCWYTGKVHLSLSLDGHGTTGRSIILKTDDNSLAIVIATISAFAGEV